MLFVYMAIAKNIERVGDLAKDMWDLAADGADMSQEPLRGVTNTVGRKVLYLIEETSRIFGERDGEAAIKILNASDVDRYKKAMHAQLQPPEAASPSPPLSSTAT